MGGWNLPPGCTDRDVDEAAGGYDEPEYDYEEEDLPPEPEEDDLEWQFYCGPFLSLDLAIPAVRSLNDSFAGRWWRFGVWPDPATATKWVIKRTWKR